MADTVRVDAAALRAAVGDDRYWNVAHPENQAWRSWVTDGFHALYNGERAAGGVVHVRAYMRDGHMVSAHTRSAPPRQEAAEPDVARSGNPLDEAAAHSANRSLLTLGMRRSLLEPQHITPVARRPDRPRGIPSGEIPTLQDAVRGGPPGPGGGSRGSQPTTNPRAPTEPPPISTRSQQLVDTVAPGGRPIGERVKDARASTRTLPGGEEGARSFLRGLMEGRSPQEITPPTYAGQMFRLHDETIVGFRPASEASSRVAAIDISIPGYSGVKKIHFR